jgi:hypothetical protein
MVQPDQHPEWFERQKRRQLAIEKLRKDIEEEKQRLAAAQQQQSGEATASLSSSSTNAMEAATDTIQIV